MCQNPSNHINIFLLDTTDKSIQKATTSYKWCIHHTQGLVNHSTVSPFFNHLINPCALRSNGT